MEKFFLQQQYASGNAQDVYLQRDANIKASKRNMQKPIGGNDIRLDVSSALDCDAFGDISRSKKDDQDGGGNVLIAV